jgi:hypothetical protein
MFSALLAHLEEGAPRIVQDPLVEKVVAESGIPVYGTVTTALIGLVGVIAAAAIFYWIISRLPLSMKNKLTPARELFFARLTIILALGALTSAGWDVWWHRAVGRDTLWETPHLFLYGFATAAVLAGLYAYHRTHRKVWKRIATALMFIPLSAPFDNLWHLLFGVEDLSRPISLSWSPPHAMLALAAIVTFALHIPLLKRLHKEDERSFFLDIVFAAIFGMSMFLVMPFHPTEGWGQVAGFWGAGIIAFLYAGVLSLAQRTDREALDATRVSIYAMILLLVSYGTETAPGIIVLPHDRPPVWIMVFAFVLTGVWLDLTRKHLSAITRAALAGGIWAAILFMVSPSFFEPEFAYPLSEAAKAVASSVIGGGIAGALVSRHKRK